MEFLASDALNGRGSGTRDEWIAATYIASQFRLWGLEPMGDEGGYVQAIEMGFTEAAPDADRRFAAVHARQGHAGDAGDVANGVGSPAEEAGAANQARSRCCRLARRPIRLRRTSTAVLPVAGNAADPCAMGRDRGSAAAATPLRAVKLRRSPQATANAADAAGAHHAQHRRLQRAERAAGRDADLVRRQHRVPDSPSPGTPSASSLAAIPSCRHRSSSSARTWITSVLVRRSRASTRSTTAPTTTRRARWR